MSLLKNLIVAFLVIFVQFFFPPECAFAGKRNYQLGRRDRVFAVDFTDKKVGWAVGDKGLALRTTDGGNTWQSQNISEQSLKDITFIQKEGWIVGENGLVLHTSDGGQTWEKQDCQYKTYLMKVFFANKLQGFIVGAYGTILKTDNGGVSWQEVPIDWFSVCPQILQDRGVSTFNLYDVFFIDDKEGWIAGDFGLILNTIDGGNTWETLNVGLLPHLFSVYFNNSQEGWSVGQNGFSIRTNDGGRHWEKMSLPTDEGLYKICMFDEYGIIVGDHGTALKTSNNGKTWSKEIFLSQWLSDVSIISSKSTVDVFCAGKGLIKKVALK